MSKSKIVCILAMASAAMAGSIAGQSGTSSTGAAKAAPDNGAGQVYHIVLPQYTPEIPDGPNVQVYERNCLLCHTARYVSMQPHFSKTVWQNEVKKMVDVYGAPISEADQVRIVEYLMAVRGVEAPVAPAAPPK